MIRGESPATGRRGRTGAWCVRPLTVIAVGASLAILTAGCGKKGSPQPPLRVRPAAVEDLSVRQRGDALILMLREPKTRTDGSRYADGEPVLLRLRRVPESALDPARSRGTRRKARQAAAGGVSWVIPREKWATYRKANRLEIPIAITSLEMGKAGEGGSLAGRKVGFVAEVQEGKRKRSLLAGPARVILCEAPPSPRGVEARNADGGILVWWEAGDKTPDKVHLYRAEGERPYPPRPYRRLEAGSGPFLDPVPPAGNSLRYQIRFASGEKPIQCESLPAEASATAVDLFPPQRPTGLAAAAEDSLIRLFWSPGAEPDLAGYLVYRSGGPAEPFGRLTPEPITATTYADTAVEPGRRYVYVVSAVDNATPPNESRWSSPAAERLP